MAMLGSEASFTDGPRLSDAEIYQASRIGRTRRPADQDQLLVVAAGELGPSALSRGLVGDGVIVTNRNSGQLRRATDSQASDHSRQSCARMDQGFDTCHRVKSFARALEVVSTSYPGIRTDQSSPVPHATAVEASNLTDATLAAFAFSFPFPFLLSRSKSAKPSPSQSINQSIPSYANAQTVTLRPNTHIARLTLNPYL